MNNQGQEPTIEQVVSELKKRLASANGLPEEELGSIIFNYIISLPNSNRLLMEYETLNKIDAMSSSMEWEDYYQNLAGRQELEGLIEKLALQVTDEYKI